MSTDNKLHGMWTQYGHERLANWLTGGDPLVITHAAVGNAGGSLPQVKPSQQGLIAEEWRGLVNSVQQNPKDATDVMVDVVLPNNIGGFWIREWGLFDDKGKLVALGPHDEMHKPLITSGQAAEFLERFHLPVSNSGAINLTIATQALATQGFVQGEIGKHNVNENSHGLASYIKNTVKIITTAPLSGGGSLEKDLTITLPNPLPITNGGTGATTAVQACHNLGAFFLCEFYYFRHPTLKPGFQPAQGGLLANAKTLYPEAWAYLQTVEGQLLCKTEAEWQAMTTAIWATLADGTKVGWNGIGGAPWFAPNTATGDLRLPDLRGMYAEAAGFDSLGVGGVHGDAIRQVLGGFWYVIGGGVSSGAFTSAYYRTMVSMDGSGLTANRVDFNSDRVVPVASKNQPRAWGSLACVYLGLPS